MPGDNGWWGNALGFIAAITFIAAIAGLVAIVMANPLA